MGIRWWWVSLPYATFGIKTENEIVVEAAPIARWSIGKQERYVMNYFDKKGARLVSWADGVEPWHEADSGFGKSDSQG
jgi:hypothetical protein